MSGVYVRHDGALHAPSDARLAPTATKRPQAPGERWSSTGVATAPPYGRRPGDGPAMDLRLRAAAVRQGGVFTRRQCYRAGLDDPELERLVAAGGPWVRVRRGAYAERDTWDAATTQQRLGLVDRAASLLMEEPHVMSHDSAARALGVPMLRPGRDLVHVTRERVVGSRTKAGVKHHLSRVELGQLRTVDCLETTGPARTALDLAREHGLDTGVVALDAVLRGGTSRAQLETELQTMWSWPGVRVVRAALGLADGRAESPAETLGRLLLVEMGHDPDVQWPISCAGSIFWTDLRVGPHVIEVEGVGKLLSPLEGGTAAASAREVVRRREDRARLIRAEGLGLSFLGWDDFWGRRRSHTKQWLGRDLALTFERYGHDLPPHLAERAELIRRTTPGGRRGA